LRKNIATAVSFLQEAYKRRHHPNLKILQFEKMKENLSQVIRDTSKFLGYPLTHRQVQTLVS
jgi:hypothetical protein